MKQILHSIIVLIYIVDEFYSKFRPSRTDPIREFSKLYGAHVRVNIFVITN